MLSSGMLRWSSSAKCHLRLIRNNGLKCPYWGFEILSFTLYFFLGFLGGVLGSSYCFSGRLSVWYAFNYYLQIDWTSGITGRISSRDSRTAFTLPKTRSKCKEMSHPWIIWDLFLMFIVFFTLPMNKSRANFHPTTSCLGMRNPPQKIDRKFGRLDLFMRCIWNQKTSYTCINVTHFKHVQIHSNLSPSS